MSETSFLDWPDISSVSRQKGELKTQVKKQESEVCFSRYVWGLVTPTKLNIKSKCFQWYFDCVFPTLWQQFGEGPLQFECHQSHIHEEIVFPVFMEELKWYQNHISPNSWFHSDLDFWATVAFFVFLFTYFGFIKSTTIWSVRNTKKHGGRY